MGGVRDGSGGDKRISLWSLNLTYGGKSGSSSPATAALGCDFVGAQYPVGNPILLENLFCDC